MSKDYVGLNICVKDVFQGVGDCGHPFEQFGEQELNTVGYAADTGNGMYHSDILMNFSTGAEQHETFRVELTKSNGDILDDQGNPLSWTFQLTTQSVPQDTSNVPIRLDLPTSIHSAGVVNPSDYGVLAERIVNKVETFFHIKRRQVQQDPTISTSFKCNFEFCSKYINFFPQTGAKMQVTSSGRNLLSQDWYNNLPGSFTPSWVVLNGLILHRNGPFGYCSWKMIRNHDKRMVSWLRENNKMTFQAIPTLTKYVYKTTVSGSSLMNTVSPKYAGLICEDEPCIISKHAPLQYNVGKVNFIKDQPSLNRFSLKTSYNNNITFFSNVSTNRVHNIRNVEDDNYEYIKTMYLEGEMDSDASPLDQFEFVRFRQTVYPPEKYTFKLYTRMRSTYKSGYWRSTRTERTVERLNEQYSDGFGNYWATRFFQSTWPMDARSNFLDPAKHIESQLNSGWLRFSKTDIKHFKDRGILQNNYSQGAVHSPSVPADRPLVLEQRASSAATTTWEKLKDFVRTAPYYARRNTLKVSGSNERDWVAPTGIRALRTLFANDGSGSPITVQNSSVSGNILEHEANWDTPIQSGRQPFHNSIEEFYDSLRPIYKDYSIIPEFRISKHVEFYTQNGIKEPLPEVFDLNGALDSASDSSKEKFYEIYSTSDLLKNFGIFIEDHEDFVEPSSITLTCKAVKKLLPYEGFYPVQRSVQLAERFYKSYNKSTFKVFTSSSNEVVDFRQAGPGFQNLLTPLFAPGIMYNTIKSGVACDYPIITGSMTTTDYTSSGGQITIKRLVGDDYESMMLSDNTENKYKIAKDTFDLRIPFEAIVEPENYLSRIPLYRNEPDPACGSNLAVFWNGKGDPFYGKMANNFIGEIPNFFLQRGGLTYFASLPSDNPNFGRAEAGRKYSMVVQMYRSMNKSGGSAGSVRYLQDVPEGDYDSTGNTDYLQETLTMYSAPYAFGPPSLGLTAVNSSNLISQKWPLAAEGVFDQSTVALYGTGFTAMMDSSQGYNFPFTPPYYHGIGACKLDFTADESKKYTLKEILSKVTASYSRFNHGIEVNQSTLSHPSPKGPQSLHDNLINRNAMQLSASVNLLSAGQLRKDSRSSNRIGENVGETNITLQVDSTSKDRWVIQTKFETPVLNFNHLTESTSLAEAAKFGTNKVSRPDYFENGVHADNAGLYVPRGMWHQYGKVPEGRDGIYLEVSDTPRVGEDSDDASLADLVGFQTKAKKIGKLATAKVISEAVVAIPFIQKSNRRQFFSIPKRDIENVLLKSTTDIAGESVRDMVAKMKRYVIPPSMDFIRYPDIDPFAMYIFEFHHLLSQQDLSNIWQGVMPDISLKHETAQASITHELLANELLGGGAKVINTDDGVVIDESAPGTKLPTNIQWMVFKVKKRANSQYSDVTITRQGSFSEPTVAEFTSNVEGAVSVDDITYNWPYDFFSLVELVKLDAEFELSDVEKDEKTKARKLKPKVSSIKKARKNYRKVLFNEDAKKANASEDKIAKIFKKR